MRRHDRPDPPRCCRPRRGCSPKPGDPRNPETLERTESRRRQERRRLYIQGGGRFTEVVGRPQLERDPERRKLLCLPGVGSPSIEGGAGGKEGEEGRAQEKPPSSTSPYARPGREGYAGVGRVHDATWTARRWLGQADDEAYLWGG